MKATQLRGVYRKEQERLNVFFEGREKQLAYIILNSVISAVAKRPRGVLNVAKFIIKDINTVLSVERLQKNDSKVYSYIDYEFKKRGKAFIKKRKIQLAKLKGFDEDNIETTKLGTYLLDILFASGCDLLQIYTYRKDMKQVALSDKAMKVFATHKRFMLRDCFTYPPMVVKPKEHTELRGTGGYLLQGLSSNLVKKDKTHLRLIEEDFNKCDRMLYILNKIQSVPWSINTRVLEIMRYIIDNNIIDPKSPKSNPKLYCGIPTFETLDAGDIIKREDYGTLDSNGRFLDDKDYDRYYKDYTDQKAIIDTIISKRFLYMYAMDIADRFSKYPEIYFTYQFDYRYRLYPMQQHLNPQQSGNIKALLQFKNGCVLDEEGLYWLKIHGANCYGKDKEPYDERIQFINERQKEIERIADDPLAYLDYWADADSPFEYLAFCFSYSDYLKDNGAVIYTPVALDATCSGIQIYSGLLRDERGGRAVNVVGSTRNDIYSDVAAVANEDLANGLYPKQLTFTTSDGNERTIDTSLEAHGLQHNITRKLTKRNVMTTPYSVTMRGMYEQVKELLDEDEVNGNIWWKGDKWVVAKLITELNAQAISKVVAGATQGQQYIKDITDRIASNDEYLKWYSPIYNLPMLQRVPKEILHRIRTPFGALLYYTPTDGINKRKMLSSIAPNFIHNLDATLMYRTVEKCLEDGVENFWLIHDSYGVLPNDVKYLNKNVREAYVELFSQDILKNWVEQLGIEFDENVMINTLNLEEVLDSEYIFS